MKRLVTGASGFIGSHTVDALNARGHEKEGDKIKNITLPIYSLHHDGSLLPNLVFHRSWNNMHSRCIEYPFAASTIKAGECILDVGSAKADPVWINYLDDLPCHIHLTDYDTPNERPKNSQFFSSDCRNLPFKDCFFDRIIAVSVIEHIGLSSPQVVKKSQLLIESATQKHSKNYEEY